MDNEIDILKKDLKGRNKKIEELMKAEAMYKGEAEHFKELWQKECAKSNYFYIKYMEAMSEIGLLKSNTEERG